MNRADKLDISVRQDLSMAAMNLISAEEHLAMTAMKTGKNDYMDVQKAVRGIRRGIMQDLVRNGEGENWCIAKHLLAATMRLVETASKAKDPKALLHAAFDAYSLFWMLQGGGNATGRKTKK